MKTKNKRKIELKKLFKPHLIVLYLVILVGAYIRLQGVFSNSFAFTYDVGRDMLALAALVNGDKISLIGPTTGIPGVFYGPWWYLMLSPFFLIFSGNPQGIALTMALLGIILVPVSYYFGNKIGGYFFGLCMAMLVAASPELIALSSQIWNPNIAPIFVLLIFLLLIKIYSDNCKPIFYFPLGLLLFLTLDVEIIFGLFFSTGVVLSILVVRKFKIKPISILFFLFGGLVILLPRMIFEVKHNFLMSNAFINYFLNGAESNRTTTNIFQVIQNRLDVFLNEFSYTLSFGNKIAGLIILFLTVGTLVYFYKKISNMEKNFLKTILIIFLIFFVGITFFAHDIWPHYLVGLPILYILLVTIAVSNLRIEKASHKLQVSILAVLFLININPISMISNFNKKIFEGDASVYRNQLAVVDYVFKDSKNEDFKYVVYTPPVHDYTYQYLFNWRSGQYGKKPVNQAKNAYFILEPDSQDPSRLVKWINERKNDGKITSEKKMTGGIIVQKRLIE